MTLDSTIETEVSFISGVAADGTVAAQSFSTWTGTANTAYGTTSKVDKWQAAGSGPIKAGTAGGTVTFAFDQNAGFSAAEQATIVAGLTLWSDETNIKFTLSSNQGTANALFTRSNDGSDESNARTISKVGSATLGKVVGQATIELGPQVALNGTMAQDSYGIGTIVHEAGHLIGLGHAGAYDDGVAAGTALTALDNDQYSIMSYNTQPAGTKWGSTVTASSYNAATRTTTTTSMPNLATTPMMLDILAAQRLYGAPTSSGLSGGQTFGFNCTIADASRMFFDFTQNTSPVVTLFSTGSNNTLDLSGFSANAVINLAQGAFSNAGGMTGNIGIAYGTVINTAIGGAGNDFFYVGGATGTQHFDGHGGVDFIGTSTASGSGAVSVSMKDGTVAKGGTLDATFTNIIGLQLAGDQSNVLGLSSGTGLVYGGTGALTFTGEGAIDYIQGSTGTNSIIGGSGAEIFFSTGGADTMVGGSGDNFMQAGQTASSTDTFGGTSGTDFVYGGAGTTTLFGGHGTEVLTGGSGVNTLFGATTADSQGHAGLNILNGGPGTDVFHAGIGTNLLYEGTGHDTFISGGGTDLIYGGAGQSSVQGGSGTTVVTTGAANQTLTAGTGTTVFNDLGAHMTAGRFDQINNFSTGHGTDIYMSAASHGATHFVAQNDGVAIMTSVPGGTAEIFTTGASLATVQAHTHFTL